MTKPKSHIIPIRLNETQHKKIIRKAMVAEVTVSEYMRSATLDGIILKQDLDRLDKVCEILTNIDNGIDELLQKENISDDMIIKIRGEIAELWAWIRGEMKK